MSYRLQSENDNFRRLKTPRVDYHTTGHSMVNLKLRASISRHILIHCEFGRWNQESVESLGKEREPKNKTSFRKKFLSLKQGTAIGSRSYIRTDQFEKRLPSRKGIPFPTHKKLHTFT